MYYQNFNSIKVRFKLIYVCTALLSARFQFHKGTIKTQSPCRYRHCQSHFNSIKVRLKHEITDKRSLIDNKFQFHKGTIKTKYSATLTFNQAIFQFHKGTIKTINLSSCPKSLIYFNSIKVRLKQRF